MAYNNYSQTDPRWQNQRLGTVNGITLGMAGCYVTADANVAEHFGKNVTPAELDNIFTDRGLYVDGNLCTDEMLEKVYPDIKFDGVYHCENIPCDLGVFNEFNNYEHEAIVELDASPAPGVQTHFCRFFDYQNGVVRIVDSQDGQIVSVADRYGNPAEVILKVVKYVGPARFVPTPEPMPEIQLPPAAPAPVAQPPVLPVVDSLSKPPVAPAEVHYEQPVEPAQEPEAPEEKPKLLPHRDSAAGRAVATARQVLVGFGGVMTAATMLINDPIWHSLLMHYAPWLVGLATALTSLVTYVENLRRGEVDNW